MFSADGLMFSGLGLTYFCRGSPLNTCSFHTGIIMAILEGCVHRASLSILFGALSRKNDFILPSTLLRLRCRVTIETAIAGDYGACPKVSLVLPF